MSAPKVMKTDEQGGCQSSRGQPINRATLTPCNMRCSLDLSRFISKSGR